jgi:metal-sulfur cluster biosynthetic enzyme
MPPSAPPEAREPSTAPPVRLKLDPSARDALRSALTGRPAGSGIRIWVERGMHPHPQMMVDHPSPRDLPVTVDGVPLLVDEASVRFLLDAEIRYRTDQDPPGFEVVGPFLPGSSSPAGAAPASPPAVAPPSAPGAAVPPAVEERIQSALKNIYDPEIPMNIVDLGLVYGMSQNDRSELTIRMTMTSPGCPAVEELVREVERAAKEASGAPTVRVEVVWEPPWGPERMSEFARRQFGYA